MEHLGQINIMLYCNVQYDEIRKIKPNMNYWKTIIQKEFFNKFVLKDEQKMLFHSTTWVL